MRVSRRLKCLNTFLKRSWAIPAVSMVLVQGVRITPFIRPWSTTTEIESKLDEGGRLVMRSTESWQKGREVEKGMRWRGGEVG